MARIYWKILNCGTETLRECCCRCPDLNIDRRRKYQQVCLNFDLPKWRRVGLKNREINNCETPDWCPLPKIIFPTNAKELISVEPVFKYNKSERKIK